MPAITPITPLEAGGEMFQRAKTPSIFNVRLSQPLSRRSESTDMNDTDFEDDSDYEPSPKSSFESDVRRRSQTTISSYDEAHTPSPRDSHQHQFELRLKPVEGPKGPHLFRASQTSTDFDLDYYLQMSPMSPVLSQDIPLRTETAFTEATIRRPARSNLTPDLGSPDGGPVAVEAHIRSWSTQQVVDWMFESGIDPSVIECFEVNDIDGKVLLALEFDHLKELDIQSFGKRHQLWNAIELLRGDDHPNSQSTPFQDISRPVTTVPERSRPQVLTNFPSHRARSATPGGSRKRRGRKVPKTNDVVTPAESVSIVAIEQLVPRPHKCKKGENCSKFRKQQRLLEDLRTGNGIGTFPISPTKGGHIVIVGNPGNTSAADNLVPHCFKYPDENAAPLDVSAHQANNGEPGSSVPATDGEPSAAASRDTYYPTSEAIPSLVASSDLLGPGQIPDFALHEESLTKVEWRDPQDNVKQFLSFQHMNSPLPPDMLEPTPSPKYEMFPAKSFSAYPAQLPNTPLPPQAGNAGLRGQLNALPRLDIPRAASAGPQNSFSAALSPQSLNSCQTATAMAPSMVYRLGTPASEMDVPVTAAPLGPVSRDASQSVPPNLHLRNQTNISRSFSRTGAPDWRRPSMQLAAVREGVVLSPISMASNGQAGSVPLQLSPVQDPAKDKPQTQIFTYGEDCSYAGWMRKRKTKLLRHEWQDAHFRLKGTQLAMHANARLSAAALDTIDTDKYAVACSSVASSSKLAAAMKAFSLKSSADAKAKSDATAFAFQLVPTREGASRPDARGKTHHFAVRTKDERIEWMRELMIARALEQKRQGFEVEVNGVAH